MFDSRCRVGQDSHRSPLCFRSAATLCDLSAALTNIHADYTADVLSEPPLGVTSDLIEFPYTTSARFCPYRDSRSRYCPSAASCWWRLVTDTY